MKYMTFNNSCFFTALANLLEDYNINIEDKDIIKDSYIPYVFAYNSDDYSYHTGYQCQQRKWINNYLGKFGLLFQEKKYKSENLIKDKLNMIDDLTKFNQKCIISLKVIEDNRWHATIFIGVFKNKYRFMNMVYKDSNQQEYFDFAKEELVDKVADAVQFGWIEKTDDDYTLDFKNVKKYSLLVLDRYQSELIEFCNRYTTYDERVIAKDRLFRPLLISYLTVFEIIGEIEIVSLLKLLQSDYIKIFKIKEEVRINRYLDMNVLTSVIDSIKKWMNL